MIFECAHNCCEYFIYASAVLMAKKSNINFVGKRRSTECDEVEVSLLLPPFHFFPLRWCFKKYFSHQSDHMSFGCAHINIFIRPGNTSFLHQSFSVFLFLAVLWFSLYCSAQFVVLSVYCWLSCAPFFLHDSFCLPRIHFPSITHCVCVCVCVCAMQIYHGSHRRLNCRHISSQISILLMQTDMLPPKISFYSLLLCVLYKATYSAHRIE